MGSTFFGMFEANFFFDFLNSWDLQLENTSIIAVVRWDLALLCSALPFLLWFCASYGGGNPHLNQRTPSPTWRDLNLLYSLTEIYLLDHSPLLIFVNREHIYHSVWLQIHSLALAQFPSFFVYFTFLTVCYLSLLLKLSYQVALERYNKMRNGAPERLVSGSDDFTMFLWEPEASKTPKKRMTGHQQVYNLASASLFLCKALLMLALFLVLKICLPDTF